MASKKVLIADSDRNLVRGLVARCEMLGLDVCAAYDGMEATFELLITYNDPPDLIILDADLPMGDGLEICRMLSDDSLLRIVSAIVLTEKLDDESARQYAELGVRCLRKGSDLWDRLEPTVVQLLGLADGESPAAEESRKDRHEGQVFTIHDARKQPAKSKSSRTSRASESI